MSTVDRRVLPLVEGQQLDRETFHLRYEAMPPDVRAELVDGTVYMPSPMSLAHSDLGDFATYWLVHYRRKTPGVGGGGSVTTILGVKDEVQPDSQLRIPEQLGGSTRIVDGYVSGPPEFVVEIGKSSRAYDLGPKKRSYERSGVREYLFVGVDAEEVHWFALREGSYFELPRGEDGLYRSEVFPGLWLDSTALFEEDGDALIAALERGLAAPEHAEFLARLAGR